MNDFCLDCFDPLDENRNGRRCHACYLKKTNFIQREKYKNDLDYRAKRIENSKKWKQSNLRVARKKARQYYKNKTADRKKEETKKNWEKILKNKYNLSLEQYQRLIDKQNNLCKLCNKTLLKVRGKMLSPVVDHDHATNEIRGILCCRCNVSVGALGDSIKSFERILKYLKREEI